MIGLEEEAPANSVPAGAVRRGGGASVLRDENPI